jgi:uncharacterized protein YhjY with autotransporter beta-barrel domain
MSSLPPVKVFPVCLLSIFLWQAALVPLQGQTPAQLRTAAQAKAAAQLKALATYDLLFQSAMNRASLLQVRQLGYLLYNHFELNRTQREVSVGGSDRKDPWNLWTQESGSFSKSTSSSSGSTSQTVNTSSGTFLLGVDFQLCRDVRAGLFSGYLPSYTTLSGGLGSASTQGLTYGGSLSYGKPQGGFYADGVISGEGFQSSTSRPVISKGKNYGTVSAAPVSTAYTLGGDSGYDVRRGRWTYGPVAMLQYSQLQANSISLSGPGTSSGTVNAQYLGSLYTGFGSHLLCSLPFNRSVTLVPEVRLFWSHEFLNGATTPTGTLSQNPGHTYSATSAPGKQNAGNAYAGITALIGKNLSSSLFYGGTVSGGDNSPHRFLFLLAGIAGSFSLLAFSLKSSLYHAFLRSSNRPCPSR